jgi:uncharacterized protein (TIGR02145 family)
MQKINKWLVLILIFFFSLPFAGAQGVIDVCATSPVTLKTGNYQYGTIQWEQSTDNEHWMPVTNAHDSMLVVMPKESTFYRAMVKFPDCPPSISEISFVQVSPKAHAGTDRLISGNIAMLQANQQEGAIGFWEILSGNEGSFSDSYNPNAFLTGTDSLYTLSYTLTNACGSHSDTIEIRFRETIFNENIAVVDTVDILHSTPRQRTEGTYIIEFSEPLPQIDVNTLLVGMGNGGYLRMVESVSINNNIYTIQTAQANLEDLIVSGPLNLGDVLNMEKLGQTEKSLAGIRRISRMPTRAEILSDPAFGKNTIAWYPMGQKTELSPNTNPLNTKTGSSSEPLVSIDLEYPSLIDAYGFELAISGKYTYSPNFIADLDYGVFGLKNVKLGSVNAIETKNMKLALDVTAGAAIPTQEFSFASITKYYLVMVGAVPVLVDVNFEINGEFDAFAGGAINISHEITETNQSNAYIQYLDKNWSYVYSKTSQSAVKNNFAVNAQLEQNFSIGPVLSFKVYSVLGPYLDYKFEENLKLCINSDLNWRANLDLKTNFKLGTKATILGKELVDFSRSWPRTIYSYSYPHSMEIWSGNNQTYIPGEPLEFNPKVKVKANNGVPLPYARVLFRANPSEEITDSIILTNAIGIAETRWTPSDTIESQLEVFVLDCENKPIDKVPAVFVAYADTTDICLTSALEISVEQSDTILIPRAHLGTPPYLFSYEDSGFLLEPPEVVGVQGETYLFTVQDQDQCLASVSFLVPDLCLNTDLAMDVVLIGDTVTVEVSGGLPPYTYSTDGKNFSSVIPELTHSIGTVYYFEVKDSYGCIVSAWFAEPDACDDFGLGFDWKITGNTLSIDPYGGFAPYSFNLDGVSFGDAIPSVEITDNTAYAFTIEDQIKCKYTAVFDPCVEYELDVSLVKEGSTVTVKANDGVPPYAYSIDGESFTIEIPVVEPIVGITYNFYVKDALGCIAALEYNICDDAGLTLKINAIDEDLVALASGGTEPYEYSLNDTLSWVSNHIFSDLQPGNYTIYLRDANGCRGSAIVEKIECDADGIRLGGQCWMRRNMDEETVGSICYDNDPANCNMYGRLYTWQAAMNVCPQGWRLPARQDWINLEEYLVMAGYNHEVSESWPWGNVENRLAKSLASKVPWQSSEIEASPGHMPFENNSTGFNGYPAGMGGSDIYNPDPGNLSTIGLRTIAWWWTSTQGPPEQEEGLVGHPTAYMFQINFANWYTISDQYHSVNTFMHLSVRCIQE